ncbi:MAG: hypothetical protein ACKO5A_10275 [Actinomycetota bacterium]
MVTPPAQRVLAGLSTLWLIGLAIWSWIKGGGLFILLFVPVPAAPAIADLVRGRPSVRWYGGAAAVLLAISVLCAASFFLIAIAAFLLPSLALSGMAWVVVRRWARTGTPDAD